MNDAYADLWSEENLAYADTETADEPWEWQPRYLMEREDEISQGDLNDDGSEIEYEYERSEYENDLADIYNGDGGDCDHNNEDCECVPPAERTEEDCEHGLSAYLCAGPSHYPPDNPFYYAR